ncbi:MAG: adenine nucleotide alpha hydrolase [Spirochaetales bacterium]|nr:adenine nucleotide alpha hydrolase [Spirochaetales bacterium]
MNSSGLPPKKAKRLLNFSKKVGRGINRFDMIQDGDELLLGISGGKDSLCLSLALALRLFRVPITYTLKAVFIEWREHPITSQQKEALLSFFKELHIPLEIIRAQMVPPSFKGVFNCYLCSRNKKRILFDAAAKLGIHKIALGHHLDDFIETTLMNICFRGEFSTMMPVQTFFKGTLKIVRPLCEVTEKEIERIARTVTLPVISINCPKKDSNQRIIMKEIIKKLSRINKRVRENIYNVPWRINEKYLPSRLNHRFK